MFPRVSSAAGGGLVLAAVISLVVAVPTARAGDGLHCRGEHDVFIDPGMTLEPRAASFRLHRLGTMTCTGAIGHHRATGPGYYDEVGRFDPSSSCAGGRGRGTFVFTIATDNGTHRIIAPFTFSYPALPRYGGLIGVEVQSEHFTGGSDLIPAEGDCVVTPLTSGHAFTEFIFP